MAKVPNLTAFPEITGELSEGMEQARPMLDQFISDVSAALNRALTLDNLSVQLKTLELAGSELPVTFNCELPRLPAAVLLAKSEVLTSGGTFTGAVDVSQWQRMDSNRIRYSSIPGLATDDTRYRLTLIIL